MIGQKRAISEICATKAYKPFLINSRLIINSCERRNIRLLVAGNERCKPGTEESFSLEKLLENFN